MTAVSLPAAFEALLACGRQRLRHFPAILLLMLGFAAGCQSAPTAQAAPKVLRAGDRWKMRTLDLTAADEKTIEAHARFATGVIEELDDDTDTALALFQQALENDPQNETLTLDVVWRLVEKRRLEDARKVLERASKQPGASGVLWGLLGSVYAMQGNPSAAIEANREAIRRMPGNIRGYQNLALIYLEAGQATNALSVLEKAADQPDTDSGFLIMLANTLGVLHQARDPKVGDLLPRIVALLDRAAAQKPENPGEILRLADLYQVFGGEKKALALYEQLLESEPDLPGLRERLAQVYLRIDDRPKAIEQMQLLAAQQPTNPLPHYLLGLLALEDKRFEDAIAAFNQVLVLRPDNQSVYLDLAGAHLGHDRPADAVAVLDQARARFKPSFLLEFYTAAACIELEQYERAVRHFVAAEVIAGATAPEQLTALFYFQSGIAHERAKRFDDAAVQFLKAIELKPDFADALNYLGYMWAEQGANLERAHELIHKAVEIEPDNAAYLDSLAWVLHQMGRSAEALPHQVRAVELNKEPDATLLDHLGDIYRKLGRIEEARAAWKGAIAVEAKPEIELKLRDTEPSGEAGPSPQ